MEYPAATACQLPLECSTFGKARDDFPRGVYGNGSRFLTFQTRFSDAGAKHTMLHRILSLSFVALALTLFIGQAALAADKVHEGTVVKAGDGKLTMTDKQGNQHSHTIPATAIITCDGKECKLEDLKAGNSVKVTTEENEKTVTKVEASTAVKRK